MAAENADQPCDLVVMDYELPGMRGDTCLARLREPWPKLKAVLITGYQVSTSDLAAPDVRVLQKPFSSLAITQAVREELDRPAGG